MKNLINILRNPRALSIKGPVENEHKQFQLQHEEHHHSAFKYQCPMKCEGDKVYDAPGNCPVCNMKLVPVDNAMRGKQHHCC